MSRVAPRPATFAEPPQQGQDFSRYRHPVISSFDIRIADRRREFAQCLAWTSDGAYLVAGLDDGRLLVTSPERPNDKYHIDAAAKSSIDILACSPSSPYHVAAALSDRQAPASSTLRQFDLRKGSNGSAVGIDKIGREAVAVAWHGRTIAISHKNRVLATYDIRKVGHKARPVKQATLDWDANSLRFGDEGRLLLAAYGAEDEGGVKVIETAELREVGRHAGHGQEAIALDVSQSEALVACGSRDMTVSVWDAHSMSVVHSLYTSDDTVRRVSFSFDGRFVAYNATNTIEGASCATLDIAVLRPQDRFEAPVFHRMTREELCGPCDGRVAVVDFCWSPNNHIMGFACSGFQPRNEQNRYGTAAGEGAIVFKRLPPNVNLV